MKFFGLGISGIRGQKIKPEISYTEVAIAICKSHWKMRRIVEKVPNATESITTSRSYENKKSQNKGKMQVKKEDDSLETGKSKIPGMAKLESMYTF